MSEADSNPSLQVTTADAACSRCGRRVTPTPEGFCPVCTHRLVAAAEGQAAFDAEPVPRTTTTAGGLLLMKGAILLVVFPVIAWVCSIGIGFMLVIPLAMGSAETQARWAMSVQVIQLVIGLACGALAAKKMWPK